MAKRAKDKIKIDFGKEEESGGGRVRWPEGDYHVKIVKAKAVRSSEKDTPGIEVTFKVLDGKKKGKTFKERLWLSPKSLRRVRVLLEAVGVKVPKKAINLPLSKLKGKTLWIELADEESEGYDTRSRVALEGFMSEEDYEAQPDDDDEDEEDEDDLDDDDDEDDDEDDEEEDEDEDDEDEEDEDEDEDEDDDDDDDDDDDEEEEKPRRKKSKSKKKSSKKSSKKKSKKKHKDDDDDIEELDLEDL